MGKLNLQLRIGVEICYTVLLCMQDFFTMTNTININLSKVVVQVSLEIIKI